MISRLEYEQGRFFVRKYRPSLVEYLNQEIGPKFDPPINFTIRFEDAYIIEPFDEPVKNKRDFAFVYPNMGGCLEAEFLSTPLVTVRNYRGGQELNHYGGVVFAAADRDDIMSVKDLKGGVVTASNFKLCQHQWRVFDDLGVHLFAETKQVRFTNKGDDAIIDDVLNGETDAAFTRTDAIESRPPEQRAKLKILDGGLPDPYLEGKKFPFKATSELYPEYGLLAGDHVEWEVQREVLKTLLEITNETYVCGPAYSPGNTGDCGGCGSDGDCFRDHCTVTPSCGICGPDFYPQLEVSVRERKRESARARAPTWQAEAFIPGVR